MWKKIRGSQAAKNAAASYLAFFSTSLWGLVSIPIAVAYLPKESIGLWTVVNAVLGYLLYLDFGVGIATGRLIADAVAERCQSEINGWWSATRVVLLSQGMFVLIVGMCFVQWGADFLNVPEHMRDETRWLLAGGVAITAMGFPMRGAPGLLTAQNRFHWVPLIQTIVPWVNLIFFYFLLRAGWGIKAYLVAMGASQMLTWGMYHLLVLTGPDRPRWSKSGLEKQRFWILLKLSTNMSVVGLVDTIQQSLPSLVLARLGGLVSVPVYNFSAKGPILGGGLVSRTYQAFYPDLQRMLVTGDKIGFRRKHHLAGMVTLGFSLVGAAAVFVVNPVLVQILAGIDYYAGNAANAWLAVGVVAAPLSGLFGMLLGISGSMGKLAPISIVKLPVAIGTAWIAYTHFGLTGLAATFALLPLVNGVYGYFRGTSGCGFVRHGLSPRVAIAGLVALVLTYGVGCLQSMVHGDGSVVPFMGRQLVTPSLSQLIAPTALGAVGLCLCLHFVRKILWNDKR